MHVVDHDVNADVYVEFSSDYVDGAPGVDVTHSGHGDVIRCLEDDLLRGFDLEVIDVTLVL